MPEWAFIVIGVIVFIVAMSLAAAFGSLAGFGRNRNSQVYEDQIVRDYQEQQRKLR
jgi:hypothetical protein